MLAQKNYAAVIKLFQFATKEAIMHNARIKS